MTKPDEGITRVERNETRRKEGWEGGGGEREPRRAKHKIYGRALESPLRAAPLAENTPFTRRTEVRVLGQENEWAGRGVYTRALEEKGRHGLRDYVVQLSTKAATITNPLFVCVCVCVCVRACDEGNFVTVVTVRASKRLTELHSGAHGRFLTVDLPRSRLRC